MQNTKMKSNTIANAVLFYDVRKEIVTISESDAVFNELFNSKTHSFDTVCRDNGFDIVLTRIKNVFKMMTTYTSAFERFEATNTLLRFSFTRTTDTEGVLTVETSMDDTSDAPYIKILDNMPSSTYIILPDEAFTVHYISKDIEVLTGYNQEKFSGTTFYRDLILKDDHNPMFERVLKAVEANEVFELHYRLKTKDGQIKDIYDRGQAVFNRRGEIVYYTGVLFDVSEQVSLKRRLEQRELVLDAVFNATKVLFETEALDEALYKSFAIIGKALSVDRVYMFENEALEDGFKTTIKYEWVNEGVKKQLQNSALKAFKITKDNELHRVLKAKKVYKRLTKDIEGVRTRELVESQNIQSLIIFPIFVDEDFYGFMGFDDCKEARLWESVEEHLLEAFSESVASKIKQRNMMLALEAQSLLQSTVFEAINSGMTVFDQNYNIVHTNIAMKEWSRSRLALGYCDDTLLVKEANFSPVKAAFKSSAIEKTTLVYDEPPYFEAAEISAYPIITGSNAPRAVVQVVRTITAQKQYERNLEYLSNYDQLTGVYNRHYFDQQLSMLEEKAALPVSILSLDVDGLKLMNDTLGHHKGDALLKDTALRIAKIVKDKGYTFARIGGDEFAILAEGLNKTNAFKFAKELRSHYERPGDEDYLSVSIGVATKLKKTETLYDILKYADDDMYAHKLSKNKSTKNQIIKALMNTLDTRDYLTREHADRLIDYSTQLAKALHLSDAQINALEILAQVHDIGKIGIPDSILFKEGPLTKQEWRIMKTHPEKGFRIASSSSDLAPIADFILKHHEHYNGKGYPLGLKGKEIPLESRILSICDAFDAMTSDRPYRKAMTKEEAINELRAEKGKQFDPLLVNIFLRDILNVKE